MAKVQTARRAQTREVIESNGTAPESAPLAVIQTHQTLATSWESQIELVKDMCCRPKNRQATDSELALFMHQCRTRRLDPLTRQIYAVFRNAREGNGWAERMTIQTSIDGFRLIAQRTGEYRGQVGPYWCGEDGEWVDVWTKSTAPVAAKVGVWREGFKEPVYAVARFESYAQWGKADGREFLTGQWGKMPDLMIAKCAEALALRRAFPDELSGIYTGDEMAQAERGEPEEPKAPASTTPPPSTPAAPPATAPAASANGHRPTPTPQTPKQKLWNEIREWSRVEATDLPDAARCVYTHLKVPTNGKATEADLDRAIQYVETMILERVSFDNWASDPKASDRKHAKAIGGLVPVEPEKAKAGFTLDGKPEPVLVREDIRDDEIPF